MEKTRVNSVCAFFNVRCRTAEFAPNPKWQVTQVRLATQEPGAWSPEPGAKSRGDYYSMRYRYHTPLVPLAPSLSHTYLNAAQQAFM